MTSEKINDCSAYMAATAETALYPEVGTGSLIAINYCLLGLGEAGEAQGKLKKVWRGDMSLEDAKFKILDECGDTLWYIARICAEFNCTLEDLMAMNIGKLLERQRRGVIQGSGDNR